AAVLSAVAPISATAQGAYPDHPLKIIVPLPPGGSPDTIARTLAQSLQERWKQPIVVENKTGGGQNIGADTVAKSAPDGYTLLVVPDNVFVTNPYLPKADDFDPLKDHAPFELVARINSEVARVLNSPEVKARLVPQGMDLVTGSPADLAALIRDEYASWGKVIREAGLKGE